MRQWQVMLAIEVTAYIKAPDEWDDPQGIGELARAAVHVEAGQGDATLDVEHIQVEDVVEVTSEN